MIQKIKGRAGTPAVGWVILALGLLGLPFPAPATEVEPAYLYLDLTPGRPASFKITVRTDKPVEKLMVQPVDYSTDRKGTISTLDLKDKRYSGKAWCRLRPGEVVVRKGRDAEIEVPMLVPAGTPGGEYFLGIQIFLPPSTSEVGAMQAVKYQVNLIVLVILRIKGATPRFGGEILEPSVTVQGLVPNFRAVFHNLSSVSVIGRMAAIIRDLENNQLDKAVLMGAASQQADGQVFLLPEGEREFTGQGNRKLPPGKYTAEIFSRYGTKSLRIAQRIDFEVQGPVVETPPLEDLARSPEKPVLEIPAGATKFQILEFKNRGLRPVSFKLSGDPKLLSFLPAEVRLEPGKSTKVRVGLHLPPAENPRRDVPITLSLSGGTETGQTSFPVSVYAPGTAPKEEGQKPHELLPPESKGPDGQGVAPPPK